MSFQKLIDDLKQHIDERFDELEGRLEGDFVEKKMVKVLNKVAGEEPAEPPPAPIESLGLPSHIEASLIDEGYATIEDLRQATADELLAVPGVGERTLEFIRGRSAS